MMEPNTRGTKRRKVVAVADARYNDGARADGNDGARADSNDGVRALSELQTRWLKVRDAHARSQKGKAK